MSDTNIRISDEITDETEVVRYLSFSRFIQQIESNSIALINITTWEDPWESPESKIPVSTDDGHTVEFSSYSISRNMYAQCWSQNIDSDAMWRIYSPDREGIMIVSTVGRLRRMAGINIGMIAPMCYYTDPIIALQNMEKEHRYRPFYSGYLKRSAFKHEEEIRILTVNDQPFVERELLTKTGAMIIPYDIRECITNIIIDPRAGAWHVRSVSKYCERAGLAVTPQKSELYEDDFYRKTKLVRVYSPRIKAEEGLVTGRAIDIMKLCYEANVSNNYAVISQSELPEGMDMYGAGIWIHYLRESMDILVIETQLGEDGRVDRYICGLTESGMARYESEVSQYAKEEMTVLPIATSVLQKAYAGRGEDAGKVSVSTLTEGCELGELFQAIDYLDKQKKWIRIVRVLDEVSAEYPLRFILEITAKGVSEIERKAEG